MLNYSLIFIMLHTQIKLPKFLGIGAAKCGTTSLHEILAQHSEIYLPEKKELHFFENDAHYNVRFKLVCRLF